MYSQYQKKTDVPFLGLNRQQKPQVYKNHNIYNKNALGNISYTHSQTNQTPFVSTYSNSQNQNQFQKSITLTNANLNRKNFSSNTFINNSNFQNNSNSLLANITNSNIVNNSNPMLGNNSNPILGNNSTPILSNNTKPIFMSIKNPKPYLGNDWKFYPNKQYDQTRAIEPTILTKQTKVITIEKQEPIIQTVNNPNWNQFYQSQQQQIEAPPQVTSKQQAKKGCNNSIWALLGLLCLAGLVVGLIIFLNQKNQQVFMHHISSTDGKTSINTSLPFDNNQNNSSNTAKIKNNQNNSNTASINTSYSQINPQINIAKTIEPQAVAQKVIQPLQAKPLLITSQVSPLLIKPLTTIQERQQIVGSKVVYLTNSEYNALNKNVNAATTGYEVQPQYLLATPIAYSSNKISYQIPIQSHLKKHFLLRKYSE